MRVFVALDIDATIRGRIARFMDGVREFAPDAKWVGPETFHITLKFIGEQSPENVERIRQILHHVTAQPFPINFSGYGFFPTPRSARVFWVGIHADKTLAALAKAVDHATAKAGIPREQHEFKPHLTLARARDASRSPRQSFLRTNQQSRSSFLHITEKLQALPEPDFGTMTATEFFLYESKLSPKGATYTKLERFPFRGAGDSARGE